MDKQRLDEVHNFILPHFYLRRDKRIIAKEVSCASARWSLSDAST